MTINNYDISVNFKDKKVIYPDMIFIQNDNLSTQLTFTFADEIANGQSVKMIFKIGSSDGIPILLTVTDKKAVYTVVKELLTVSGYATISLTLIEGEKTLTNPYYIENIIVKAQLNDNGVLTPEDISLVNQFIAILNVETAKTELATLNAETATTNANDSAANADVSAENANEAAVNAQTEADALETVLLSKADKLETYTKPEVDIIAETKEPLIGYTPEDASKKGFNFGYAGLDANGKIILTQLPDSMFGQLKYEGIYDVSTGSYPVDGVKGQYYIASSNGVIETVDFKIGDWLVYNGSVWDKIDNTDAVSSINGKIGNVVLTTDDIADSTDKRYVTELEKAKIANSLIAVTHDNTLSGSGTIADPLKVVKNEVILPDYATWKAMYDADTLDANVEYSWELML